MNVKGYGISRTWEVLWEVLVKRERERERERFTTWQEREREPKRLDFERERESKKVIDFVRERDVGWVGKWGLNGGGSLGRFEREKEYRVCNGH